MKRSRSSIFLIVAAIAALLLGIGVGILAHNAIVSSSFTLPALEAPQPSANTQAGAQTTPKAEKPKTFVISMVGDCTLASSQYNNDYDSYINKHGLSWPFSGTVEYLENDEFSLANLECTFSDQSLSSSTLFQFQAPASYADILKNGSVEYVTLGNNHTYDFGEKGLTDTKAALDSAGVGWTGPGESKVYTTEHGLKIGVYCPGWTGLSESNIVSGIETLRQAGADVIIMSVHWGTEGSYTVTA